MKLLLTILIVVLAGLLSCNKDEVGLPLTPELVSEIHTYDLDNNGNSSDIRLDFKVENNLNVVEYRIMIVPLSVGTSFIEEIAASVPPTNYLEVPPESFQNQYSIVRLPAGLLNVNGGQIQNGIEYVAAVYVIGEDDQQLSELSLPFILKDWGIYSGRYWIGEVTSCQWYDGTSELDIEPTGRFFIDLTSSDGSEYSGIYKFDGGSKGVQNIGRISLSVEGSLVSDYSRENASTGCTGGEMLNGEICPFGDTCPLIEQGAIGSIIDELILEIEINTEDCLRICTGQKIFVRQG